MLNTAWLIAHDHRLTIPNSWTPGWQPTAHDPSSWSLARDPCLTVPAQDPCSWPRLMTPAHDHLLTSPCSWPPTHDPQLTTPAQDSGSQPWLITKAHDPRLLDQLKTFCKKHPQKKHFFCGNRNKKNFLLNIPQKICNIFHLKFPHNKLHQIPQRTMQIFADLYALKKNRNFLR